MQFIRFIFSCLVFTFFVWFVLTVPVGKYTLWEHTKRIASTKEAQELSEGAKAVAKDAASRVQQEVAGPANKK